MEDRYWNFMCTSKYEIYYLEAHLSLYIMANRAISILSVVFSSIALGMWAILQNCMILWSTIIIVSQIIVLINNILPYKQRIKDISKLKLKLYPMQIDIEHDWYAIKSKQLDDEEINTLITTYSKKLFDEYGNYFDNDSLPCFNKLVEKATDKMCNYYSNSF